MRGPVQTQLVRATWPQDQGRILSPVVPRRDVGLSPSILQAGGCREHQEYPKVGYAGSPGLLCGAQAASALWLLSRRRDPSTAPCPLPCRYTSASARCWLDAGGFWLRDGSRSWVPPALPRSPSHAGALRGGSAQHPSPRCSPARRRQSSPGSALPGDRFSLKATVQAALRRPSPKG